MDLVAELVPPDNLCTRYYVSKITMSCPDGSVTWEWLTPCPEGGDPDDDRDGYSVTVSDSFSACGCPDFVATLAFYSIDWTLADHPASIDIVIAGATGSCCTKLNGTQTLDYAGIKEHLPSCVTTHTADAFLYRKIFPADGPCPELQISLGIQQGNALGGGSPCGIGIFVIIGETSVGTHDEIIYGKVDCPAC